MKTRFILIALSLLSGASLCFAQTFPLNTSLSNNAWNASIHSNGTLASSGTLDEPMVGEPVIMVANPSPPAALLSAPLAAASSSSSSFALDFDTYPQDIQNIVRACDGDIYKIFDLIRNNVEFQPYFGFRKSPEVTWQSRRGNDADQAFLLVECLRAAGFVADFQYGVLILSDTEALDWFGVDNVAALNQTTGSAGYFGGDAPGIYGIEQIWCSVVVDGFSYPLAPAYKTYEDLPGIDLANSMNYTQAGLLSAAAGTETATYVQSVSEPGVNGYLQARAMDLVQDLQTNHPTAEVDEIISGRRIIESNLAADFSNGFYTTGAFVSGGFDSFIFDDAYGDYLLNGTTNYSFYAFMSLAVGEVNGAGDAFISAPSIIYGLPTGLFTGRKLALTFDDDFKAELRVDDVIVGSESATPNSNPIGWGYLIEHPYDRSAGTLYDEVRVRPVGRDSMYVYTYDSGGAGESVFSNRRRQILEGHTRDGLTSSDPEVATEALYLLGLNWTRQYDLATQMIAAHREFIPILHHTMALIQQESGFSVDIPSTLTTIPRDGTPTGPGRNIRALIMMGSAMEHSVIEQNYPDFNAVSTVRYIRENNFAGGKTFLATSANYSSIQTDTDFIAGWSSTYRNTFFPAELTAGSDLIIPEEGSILLDSLSGSGFYTFSDTATGAIINPGQLLKGGFATTPGFIDFSDNPFPVDPTIGPDSLPNPESDEPIDMLTGAYVYDGTDLSLSGAGVRGLAFTRHYSSLASAKNRGLGMGWSHSYESSIIEHTDVDAGLGAATPVHAASLIAATWAISNMVDLPTSPKAWVIGSLSSYWGMEELNTNTATVSMGRRTLPFTKLADGTFLPPAGMTGTLTQDSGTNLYSLEERFDVVADFNADNKLETITDSDGKQMTIAYVSGGAAEGKVQTVTDAYNRTLTFTYIGELLDKVADSTGRDVDFAYTGELLTGVTDPEEHTTTYAYDTEERIEQFFNKEGEKIAHNTYDEFGQVCLQVAEDDAAQEWEYAFTGVLNTEINPDREFLSYIFDDKGRTIQTINGEGDTTNMDFDGQNQIIRLTDPKGNITRFEYDARNNLRFTYDARNGATGTTYKVEQQYDTQNRLWKVIDEEAQETVFGYDTEHHLETITDPLLRETSYTYFTSGIHDGLVETITTPGAMAGQTQVTTNAYDSNGYPNNIIRPDASVVTQNFNARGDLLFAEVTTTGETNTYPVTNTYDLNRRLLTTDDNLGFGGVITYDNVGNVKSTTDRFGNESTANYSPLSRVEDATGSDGETTIFGYDHSGRRDKFTNPLSQETNIAYDNAGRLETTTNALSEVVTNGYDAAGNRTGLQNAKLKDYVFSYTANNLLESLTTPLLRKSNYEYDDRLLLKEIEEPSTQTTNYHYYDDSRLEQTVDPTGTIDFYYDAKGRLQTVTEGSNTLIRAYDDLDRVTSFTDSAGNIIGYKYDGGNHLTKLTYPASKGDVDYKYDNAGRLEKVTDWATRETEFFYDTDSRLQRITYPNGTQREFFYDAAGRVERQTDTLTADGSILLDQQYKFDALGRISEEVILPEPATYSITPVVMTYDNDDRIDNWQSGVANISPLFDDDGNMTTGVLEGASETFIYDSRNRLEQAGASIYSYDAEERRIGKTEGGIATTYVHDPHAPLSRLLQKTTASVTTYYVYAGGQLLYEETAGQITLYHFDSRGSTLALSDSSGVVSNRITYGAYGEIVATTVAPSTPFLYNGAYGVQTDANGLLHMRARYYSTEMRRFLNSDPIGFAGGMNWFAYVDGNPISYLDPSGLIKVDDFSTAQLFDTLEGVKKGQKLMIKQAFLGKDGRTEIKEGIADGTVERATPSSGSKTDPVIHRFEKDPIEKINGFFMHIVVGQGMNLGNVILNDGDFVDDFLHFTGLIEIGRHQRLIDDITQELEKRGVDPEKGNNGK